MVAVDDAGRPAEVPPLAIGTPAEVRRHRAAELRRGLRREIAVELERAAEGTP
jgi:acyl-CoA hydrolase